MLYEVITRAGAKNFKDVLIVSSMKQYGALLEILNSQNGETTLEQRKAFAGEAFQTSSHYDSAISTYFAPSNNKVAERISLNDGEVLRYGENPHQSATIYKYNNSNSDSTLANASVLQGKALSYNNMLDADAAWKAVSDA